MIDENDIYTYLDFKYSFTSSTGEIEGNRYILEIDEDIVGNNEADGEFLIGKAKRYMILLGQAQNENYDFFEIFDTNGELVNILMDIYDLERGDIKENLEQEIFGKYGMMEAPNICIFSRLQVLPKYRGHGIAKKIIKDNLNILGPSCGLIVAQPYPLQFEYEGLHDTDFEKAMEYDRMEQDEVKANAQLRKYYKSIGYKESKICKDLMFIAPDMKNAVLDKVDLNDDSDICELRK